MTVPELDNLVRVNQLKVEAGTQFEFDGLVRSGLARLKDVEQIPGLSQESRFDLAYNARPCAFPCSLALAWLPF